MVAYQASIQSFFLQTPRYSPLLHQGKREDQWWMKAYFSCQNMICKGQTLIPIILPLSTFWNVNIYIYIYKQHYMTFTITNGSYWPMSQHNVITSLHQILNIALHNWIDPKIPYLNEYKNNYVIYFYIKFTSNEK